MRSRSNVRRCLFLAYERRARSRSTPKRAAVVVVDMINEFCKPGGKMVLPGYESLVPPQLSVIRCRAQGGRAGHLGA